MLRRIGAGTVGLAAVLSAANPVKAQVFTAFDVASSYTSTGFTGNQGYGFGAWSLNTSGGGSYISNDGGTHPNSFGLWNNTANASSTALRPFNAALAVGQSFSCDFLLNNLDTSLNSNGFMLQDSGGNSLFSFYHHGGDGADGWFADSNGTGVATGFSYNYQNFSSLTFTLNSDTTYTFTDNTTAASFSGTVSGTIDEVTFLRANANDAPGNGQDFKFDTLAITSVPEPSMLALGGAMSAAILFLRRRGMN